MDNNIEALELLKKWMWIVWKEYRKFLALVRQFIVVSVFWPSYLWSYTSQAIGCNFSSLQDPFITFFVSVSTEYLKVTFLDVVWYLYILSFVWQYTATKNMKEHERTWKKGRAIVGQRQGFPFPSNLVIRF